MVMVMVLTLTGSTALATAIQVTDQARSTMDPMGPIRAPVSRRGFTRGRRRRRRWPADPGPSARLPVAPAAPFTARRTTATALAATPAAAAAAVDALATAASRAAAGATIPRSAAPAAGACMAAHIATQTAEH